MDLQKQKQNKDLSCMTRMKSVNESPDSSDLVVDLPKLQRNPGVPAEVASEWKPDLLETTHSSATLIQVKFLSKQSRKGSRPLELRHSIGLLSVEDALRLPRGAHQLILTRYLKRALLKEKPLNCRLVRSLT